MAAPLLGLHAEPKAPFLSRPPRDEIVRLSSACLGYNGSGRCISRRIHLWLAPRVGIGRYHPVLPRRRRDEVHAHRRPPRHPNAFRSARVSSRQLNRKLLQIRPRWRRTTRFRTFPGNHDHSLEITTLSWKSRPFPGNHDPFPEITALSWKSRPFPGNHDPFLEITTLSWKSRPFPGNHDPFLEITTLSWKSRPFPGNHDPFLEITTLSWKSAALHQNPIALACCTAG